MRIVRPGPVPAKTFKEMLRQSRCKKPSDLLPVWTQCGIIEVPEDEEEPQSHVDEEDAQSLWDEEQSSVDTDEESSALAAKPRVEPQPGEGSDVDSASADVSSDHGTAD